MIQFDLLNAGGDNAAAYFLYAPLGGDFIFSEAVPNKNEIFSNLISRPVSMRLIRRLGISADVRYEIAVRHTLALPNSIRLIPRPGLKIHKPAVLTVCAPRAVDPSNEQARELLRERMKVIEIAPSGLNPAAVSEPKAAFREIAGVNEHFIALQFVCPLAIVNGKPLRHLGNTAVKPTGVVRSAELCGVPGENPVRRPLRKPFFALLKGCKVEIKIRRGDIGLGTVGMREIKAIRIHLTGNRRRELDIVHDSALFTHLTENFGPHIALGAYLVDTGRGGHYARIIAPGTHPRLKRTLKLLCALRVAADRFMNVINRRHTRKYRNSCGRLTGKISLIFPPIRPMLMRLVRKVVAVKMNIRRVCRKPLIPKAAKPLHMTVEHDLLALAPDLAKADHRTRTA